VFLATVLRWDLRGGPSLDEPYSGAVPRPLPAVHAGVYSEATVAQYTRAFLPHIMEEAREVVLTGWRQVQAGG
jgi:hypothetical protein